MDRLPPLNALRAFEAAARHLSITLAAEELHVTPGAVSRQIKLLEAAGVADAVDAQPGMTYQSSCMAYTAAMENLGLVMAQMFLVQDDLASGKLVRPFRTTVDMGDYTYDPIQPAGRAESVPMQQFRQWLLGKFGPAPDVG